MIPLRETGSAEKCASKGEENGSSHWVRGWADEVKWNCERPPRHERDYP